MLPYSIRQGFRSYRFDTFAAEKPASRAVVDRCLGVGARRKALTAVHEMSVKDEHGKEDHARLQKENEKARDTSHS